LKSLTRRAVFAHLPGPVWNDRYESLRAAWQDAAAGWGQDLFVKQGLVAWMKAWPVEEETRTRRSGSAQQAAGEWSAELQRQVTGELVNMILQQHQDSSQEVGL